MGKETELLSWRPRLPRQSGSKIDRSPRQPAAIDIISPPPETLQIRYLLTIIRPSHFSSISILFHSTRPIHLCTIPNLPELLIHHHSRGIQASVEHCHDADLHHTYGCRRTIPRSACVLPDVAYKSTALHAPLFRNETDETINLLLVALSDIAPTAAARSRADRKLQLQSLLPIPLYSLCVYCQGLRVLSIALCCSQLTYNFDSRQCTMVSRCQREDIHYSEFDH